jgi:superfamily I DNA/RNA helicase
VRSQRPRAGVHIAKRYESALHACNAVDFDDLILLTLRLFREHPDALAACRAKYQYVMVDEYQDTNAAQFRAGSRADAGASESVRGRR